MSTNDQTNTLQSLYTNYAAYKDSSLLGQFRIGHLDVDQSSIQPLTFSSGAPLTNLDQVFNLFAIDFRRDEIFFLRFQILTQ